MANRYRCTACGNLTRFDVVTSRRTRAYHHFTIGGDLRIEDEAVLDERVEQVTCRWCGTGTAVEHIDGDGSGDATVDEPAAGSASAVSDPGAN